MSRTNARRAILLTALMLFVPIAQADLSEWRGLDAVRPSDAGSDFTALRVPSNATVLDSWMEISNEEVAQSSENLPLGIKTLQIMMEPSLAGLQYSRWPNAIGRRFDGVTTMTLTEIILLRCPTDTIILQGFYLFIP